MARALPEGFQEVRRPGHWIVFDATLAADLERLGWLEPGGLARMLDAEAGAPGAEGRGHTLRRRLPVSGVELLVRPLLHGGLLGGLLGGALRSGDRVLHELTVTAALRAAGAPVPRPALAAARRTGLAWNAWLATVFETEAPDALAWLETRPPRERLLPAVAACARAIRRFHDAGGTHADLHLKNLLVRDTGDDVEIVIVDLDGASCGEPPDPARRMRELARLYRSSLKRGVADQLDYEGQRAFLQAYVDGDGELGAALARNWPRERRRVALHAVRYKGG